MSRKKLVVILIVAVIALLTASIALAAALQIDNFDTGTLNISVNTISPQISSAVDTNAAALGGDREAVLTWVSGNGSAQANIDIYDTNRLNFNQDNGVSSLLLMRWDGIDAQPTVNNQGLTGADSDFTGGGTNNAFDLEVVNDDTPATVILTVYSTSANWSQFSLNLPGGINTPAHVDFVVPFGPGNGWVVGAGSGADFTAVTSLEVLIDGTVTAGADVAIDFFDADNFREYGDLPGVAQGGPVQYPASIVDAYQSPQGLRLGSNTDVEAASQPAIGAGTVPNTGDNRTDIVGEVNDEEGVVVPSNFKWSAGSPPTNGGRVRVTFKGCQVLDGCFVNGWIDWGNDGSFSEAGDHVVNEFQNYDSPAFPGYYERSFPIPNGTNINQSFYARFRICEAAGACNSPSATNVTNGEIEDYYWSFGPLAVTLSSLQAQPTTSPVVPVALVGVSALALIGVVFVARRRKTA